MILFYVQHLLGSGHVYRIRLIAEELACRGQDVAVITGGMPMAGVSGNGVRWIQIEAVRSSGADFASVVDTAGRPVDAALFERRARRIAQSCRELRPRVVVIESWPFGRRQFRMECLAMIDEVRNTHPGAVVACSVRDIVQHRRDDRENETARLVRQYFDAVLVHGDPRVVALDESFGRAAEIADKLVYTGYVAPAPVPRTIFPEGKTGEVVVAAGGGAAGMRLYETALAAARLDQSGRRWRLLVGSGVSEREFERLRSQAGEFLYVERNRADFRELIAGAGVLVSQAGYNTVADVLVTGVPSLLVPFESHGETEQLARARRFESLGRVAVVREAQIEPAVLLDRLNAVLSEAEPIMPVVDLEGVCFSADWIAERG